MRALLPLSGSLRSNTRNEQGTGDRTMIMDEMEFGTNIRGVDARSLGAGELERIQDILYRRRLVVLKDQSLDEQAFCDVSRRFGTPIPYLQSNYHHPEYPLIFISSNVKQDGRQMGVPRTGGYWHSDTSFEPDPKFITMLLPRVLPASTPRTTRFIDMSEVYAVLPRDLRAELEGAVLLHSGRWRYKVRPEDAGLDITEILEMIDHHAPPVRHPAVITHPHTGEKGVYASRGFTVSVDGRGRDGSARILAALFDFAESGRFTREVRWAMGDLIIWDNRFLVHSSGRKKAPTENIHEEIGKEEATMMYRITLRDHLPLSAEEARDLESTVATHPTLGV